MKELSRVAGGGPDTVPPLIAGHRAGGQRLSHAGLVAIGLSGVDETIAKADRGRQHRAKLAGRDEPEAKPDLRNLTAIVHHENRCTRHDVLSSSGLRQH